MVSQDRSVHTHTIHSLQNDTKVKKISVHSNIFFLAQNPKETLDQNREREAIWVGEKPFICPLSEPLHCLLQIPFTQPMNQQLGEKWGSALMITLCL